MLRRREFLGAAYAPLASAPRQRPNVLLVTSDQESALLPADLRLPNRRRLQERGATFSHAFCNTPQCSPARGSLLTGLEPHHAGVVTNIDGTSLGIPPSTDLPALGTTFRSAGYATGFFGKWHLGAKGPSGFGFETQETSFNQNAGNQSDEPVAHAAAEWMRKQKGPWMAWVSLVNPHDIYFPPGGYEKVAMRPGVRAPLSGTENLANKPAEQMEFARLARSERFQGEGWLRYRSYYCELTEKVDALLGVLLEAAWSAANRGDTSGLSRIHGARTRLSARMPAAVAMAPFRLLYSHRTGFGRHQKLLDQCGVLRRRRAVVKVMRELMQQHAGPVDDRFALGEFHDGVISRLCAGRTLGVLPWYRQVEIDLMVREQFRCCECRDVLGKVHESVIEHKLLGRR